MLPNTWKFLWAPIVDTTLGRKTWYVIGVALTAAGVMACGVVPATPAGLSLLSGLVLVTTVGSTFLAMATESLIPHHTPDDQRGRASGWLQAGNLGGSSIGGGAALWIAQHVAPTWSGAAALAVACLFCALPLAWIPSTPKSPIGSASDLSKPRLVREQYRRLGHVLRSLWSLARSRRGYLGMLVVFLPIGTGAASNLWAAVADGWRASADTVALVNGVLGGLAAAVGCMVGGYYCDRVSRKFAYALFGAFQAACLVAMALAPHTEPMYMLFTLAYAILNGMSYAGYSAVAFEAIGLQGAATQFNAYSSLSTIPIIYMGLVDGRAYAKFGASGMLYAEALVGVGAIVFYFVVSEVTSGAQPPANLSEAPHAS